MTAHSVFISHASVDGGAASLIAEALERQGISCWIAPRDVLPGQRYAEAILDGIENCEVFLLLYSANAASSQHVLSEVERATHRNKALLLVRLDETDPRQDRSFAFFVSSHQWLDASRGSLQEHIPAIESAARPFLQGARPAVEDQYGTAGPGPASASARRSIGIEFERSKLRGLVIDLDQPDIYGISPIEMPIPPSQQNARSLITVARELIAQLLEKEFTDGSAPEGIGLAVPGQVDVRTATLKFGPSLYGASNVPFRSALASAFPRIPIRADNAVRCATRAELHLGMGEQFDDFACLRVGAGVGSGIVISRRVHYGHNFCAGELGHFKVSRAGEPCSCGQFGCLETFIKADAVVTRVAAGVTDAATRERGTILPRTDLTIETIAQACDAGDEVALEALADIGQSLGLGIANYLNLINPGAIVLGGEVIDKLFFHMTDAVTDAVRRNALAEVSQTPIIQSSITDDWFAVGAALLFHEDTEWVWRS